jgi:small redox-active disulfide protein 2
MDIKILGPGCKNCVTLDRITRETVKELGIKATIEKVEDYGQIASYGVMTTPALVVDGKVLIAGRVPTPSHLRELLTGATLSG